MDLKTGRTGQKIPENDTEKIQFSRPIRDTHGRSPAPAGPGGLRFQTSSGTRLRLQ